MDLKWISIMGEFTQEKSDIIFHGKEILFQDVPQGSVGNFICNEHFAGGTIEADFLFEELDKNSACELILYYDPARVALLTAGLGGLGANFSIRFFGGEKWDILSWKGDKANLTKGQNYHVKATLIGSTIKLSVNGVDVSSAALPVPLPQSQVGLWCQSTSNIQIKNYKVIGVRPKVFVVMEFNSPYNEIYSDVIKRIAEEFGVDTIRADETFGPGIILADIVRQITESKAIIAEITPANPNVYYEVGYAHALAKPTILVADKSTKLPFDVSPFRVLFYENTIAGKSRFEDGLRKHLTAILTPGKIPAPQDVKSDTGKKLKSR